MIYQCLLEENELVFVSLNLETGEDNCDIIKILIDSVRLELNHIRGKAAKEALPEVVWRNVEYHTRKDTVSTIFSKYVNPGKDSEWTTADVAYILNGLSRLY